MYASMMIVEFFYYANFFRFAPGVFVLFIVLKRLRIVLIEFDFIAPGPAAAAFEPVIWVQDILHHWWSINKISETSNQKVNHINFVEKNE